MTSEGDKDLNQVAIQSRARENREKADIQRRAEALQKVFAVRLPPPSKDFGWEIRRFGSFVLSRSDTEYPTSVEAKAAGEAAMAAGAAER